MLFVSASVLRVGARARRLAVVMQLWWWPRKRGVVVGPARRTVTYLRILPLPILRLEHTVRLVFLCWCSLLASFNR
jgi:hypothetical protein